MKNYFIIVLLLLSSALLSPAQKKEGRDRIDSLLQELKIAKLDSGQIKILNALSTTYYSIDPAEGLKCGKRAEELSKLSNWSRGEADAYNSIATNFYAQSNYPKALEYYFKARDKFEKLGIRKEIAKNTGNIGNVYNSEENYPKALEYYFEALKLYQESGNQNGISYNLGNIGTVYYKLRDYQKALDYDLRALKINELTGNKTASAATLGNLGIIYTAMGDYLNALDKNFKALKINTALGDKRGMAINLGNIGGAYQKINNLNEAEKYLKNAITLTQEIGYLEAQKYFFENLSEVYTQKSDWKNALASYKMYMKIRDSLSNEENTKKTLRIEMNYEFDKREAAMKAEREKKDVLEKAELRRQKIIRNGSIAGFIIMLIFSAIFLGQRTRVSKEKKRSDELLLNILPKETAEELKKYGHAAARRYEGVTVLFADVKNFTLIAEQMTPEQLVEEIDRYFRAFDEITTRHDLEKIKTIGDAYLCVGGLPEPGKGSPLNVVRAAFEMQQYIAGLKLEKSLKNEPYFEVRIGIHTGPVVAGVVGKTKFAYDIWGDSVNTAFRLEENSEPGKINISETTYQLIKGSFECKYRGEITAKNKGELSMYFVERAKQEGVLT